MSLRAAIHYAICTQLAVDSKSVIGLGDTLSKTVGNAVAYEEAAGRRFLANVALRMRADTPSLIFKWSAVTENPCTYQLWMLEDRICENTTFASEIKTASDAGDADQKAKGN